jgi:hypothetical protein
VCAVLGAQQPSPSAEGQTVDFGFEQRVRNENWNNILDYSDQADDQRNQIRYRTRVWMKAPLGSKVDFFVGLNQETNQKLGKDNAFDEVIFDAAYLDFKQLFVKGLSLRVGRQNLMRGEGFILLEGNPGDGSRSIYFNGFDLAYARKKAKIEVLGILNPREDRLLPRINPQKKPLQDWNDQALGVYYTNANRKRTSFEAYYFYKKEVKDYLPVKNPQFQPDRHVHTAGGRVVELLTPKWSATGEFATQWGAQHPNTKISAWSGYSYLKRNFTNSWKPYALFGYWAMSGNNPATPGTIGNWDPIFSRWPKWSELYIYSQVREVGVGYWTNLGMWQAETGFSPRKPLNCRLTYYRMNALHPFPGDQRYFGDGTGRGDNIQGRLDFLLNRSLSGHVLYEHQLPGNFYRVQNQGYFLRFEMIYQVKGSVSVNRLKQLAGLKPSLGAPAIAGTR